MNSKYGGTMGYQRLIKTIKSIGGGGELTADSIDSSHIINGSILNGDISNNTVELEKLETGLQSKINDSSKQQGIISIRNATLYAQGFSYTLSYKDIYWNLTQFASYTNLATTLTASHFYKLPNPTDCIYIQVSNEGGVSVESADAIYGVSLDEIDGNNILLFDDIVGNNIMIEIEVAI